ncbi:hypothetical protein ScPMuIL_007206 [Solemya velum]
MTNESFNGNFTDLLVQTFPHPLSKTSAYTCTSALIGGAVNDVSVNETSVRPSFRSSLASMSCGIGWTGDGATDSKYEQAAILFGQKLQDVGDGVYLNEPSGYLPNWKQDFWGSNYEKLLRIKHEWDPEKVLTCKYCVGSDEPRE